MDVPNVDALGAADGPLEEPSVTVVTTKQIEALLAESKEAGHEEMVRIARAALGERDVPGIDPRFKHPVDARDECVRAIAEVARGREAHAIWNVPSCPWLPPTSPVLPQRFTDLAAFQLILRANVQGATCHRLAPRGELSVAITDVLAGLQALGYRVLRASDASAPVRRAAYPTDYEASFLLVHPFGCVEVDASDERPLRVLCIDERQVAVLRERIVEWVRPWIDRSAGVLYMLKSDDCEGFGFSEIGTGGRPLRRENYAPSVLEGIDHVALDIEATDPCGRISLLTGPPGTGKTHLIRGVLASAKQPCFVVLQSSDLLHFLDASPLSALTHFARGEAKGRPIVLVIEDADACLVPRAADNISLISALLNLSDGLIGATFDIRILASTNSRHVEIDPAILRPGRLCRRVDVLPLEADHATAVLGGLLGATPRTAFRKATTLAEVYAAAREQATR